MPRHHAVPSEQDLNSLVIRMMKMKAPKHFVMLTILVFYHGSMPQVPQAGGVQMCSIQ